MSNEQTHPLHEKDRNIIDSLISKKNPDELDLVNLARLIKRYANFPGELELKKDFLPSGSIKVGITSGASTPDKVVADVIEKLVDIAS